MTNLVKIEGLRYTFYKGNSKVISVEAEDPLEYSLLEYYRKNPNKLVQEMKSEDPELA